MLYTDIIPNTPGLLLTKICVAAQEHGWTITYPPAANTSHLVSPGTTANRHIKVLLTDTNPYYIYLQLYDTYDDISNTYTHLSPPRYIWKPSTFDTLYYLNISEDYLCLLIKFNNLQPMWSIGGAQILLTQPADSPGYIALLGEQSTQYYQNNTPHALDSHSTLIPGSTLIQQTRNNLWYQPIALTSVQRTFGVSQFTPDNTQSIVISQYIAGLENIDIYGSLQNIYCAYGTSYNDEDIITSPYGTLRLITIGSEKIATQMDV